jgi:hypothetical protein
MFRDRVLAAGLSAGLFFEMFGHEIKLQHQPHIDPASFSVESLASPSLGISVTGGPTRALRANVCFPAGPQVRYSKTAAEVHGGRLCQPPAVTRNALRQAFRASFFLELSERNPRMPRVERRRLARAYASRAWKEEQVC